MEPKRCEYCGKKLSPGRRSDARYCPTSRCRVGGYRERVLRGTHLNAPRTTYAARNPRGGAKVILRWQEEGLQLVKHPWCQARAEALAYKIMKNRCSDLRDQASERAKQTPEPDSTKEIVLGPFARITLSDRVKYVGLVLIPAECGGGAVLVTGKD